MVQHTITPISWKERTVTKVICWHLKQVKYFLTLSQNILFVFVASKWPSRLFFLFSERPWIVSSILLVSLVKIEETIPRPYRRDGIVQTCIRHIVQKQLSLSNDFWYPWSISITFWIIVIVTISFKNNKYSKDN